MLHLDDQDLMEEVEEAAAWGVPAWVPAAVAPL